ncbi:MAG: methionyl-tRNA formyltransferase [Clostridiaceae bacterium]
MKIAFLGTPEFALPSLDMLFQSGHELGVFTQPDRPVGRHAVLTPPPTKVYAMEHGIPVFQFEKIRLPEGLEALKSFAPDLMVTAAFGQILSAENLTVPKCGCINVHGSLLPKYRGAAPIQWAVINGETETGITTMMTDFGMDTGDILMVERVTIGENETAGDLFERLSVLGAETLKRTIAALEAGTLVRTPQNELQATKCPMLKKEHGRIDFNKTARDIHNLVRGTNPWPGAYALLDGEPLKIHATRMSESDLGSAQLGSLKGDAKTGLFVLCQDGWLEITELQASGSKRMSAKDFVKGHPPDSKILA